jgi:hypothetical protein
LKITNICQHKQSIRKKDNGKDWCKQNIMHCTLFKTIDKMHSGPQSFTLCWKIINLFLYHKYQASLFKFICFLNSIPYRYRKLQTYFKSIYVYLNFIQFSTAFDRCAVSFNCLLELNRDLKWFKLNNGCMKANDMKFGDYQKKSDNWEM